MARTKQSARKGRHIKDKKSIQTDVSAAISQNQNCYGKPGKVQLTDPLMQIKEIDFLNQLDTLSKFSVNFYDFRSLYADKSKCLRVLSLDQARRNWFPSNEWNCLKNAFSYLVSNVGHSKVQNAGQVLWLRWALQKSGDTPLAVIADHVEHSQEALCAKMIAVFAGERALARFLFENYLHFIYNVIKKKRDPICLYEPPHNIIQDIGEEVPKPKLRSEYGSDAEIRKPKACNVDMFLNVMEKQLRKYSLRHERRGRDGDKNSDEIVSSNVQKPKDVLLHWGCSDAIEDILITRIKVRESSNEDVNEDDVSEDDEEHDEDGEVGNEEEDDQEQEVKQEEDVNLEQPTKQAVDINLEQPTKQAVDINLEQPIKQAVDINLEQGIKQETIDDEVKLEYVYEAILSIRNNNCFYKAYASSEELAVEAVASLVIQGVFGRKSLAKLLLRSYINYLNATQSREIPRPQLFLRLQKPPASEEPVDGPKVQITRDRLPCLLMQLIEARSIFDPETRHEIWLRENSEVMFLDRERFLHCMSPSKALADVEKLSLDQFDVYKYQMGGRKGLVYGCVNNALKNNIKHQAYSTNLLVAFEAACAMYLSLEYSRRGGSELACETLFRFEILFGRFFLCYKKLRIKENARDCYKYAIKASEPDIRLELELEREAFDKTVATVNENHRVKLNNMYSVQMMQHYLSGNIKRIMMRYAAINPPLKQKAEFLQPDLAAWNPVSIAGFEGPPRRTSYQSLLTDQLFMNCEPKLFFIDGSFIVNLKVNNSNYNFTAKSANSIEDALMLASQRAQCALHSDKGALLGMQKDLTSMLQYLAENCNVTLDDLSARVDQLGPDKFSASVTFKGMAVRSLVHQTKNEALLNVVSQCFRDAVNNP